MIKFKENIRLAEHTSFKIGGEAKYFFEAKTKEELVEALEKVEQLKLRFFILAGGSNVLFPDRGFDGVVIKIGIKEFREENGLIYAAAGAKLLDIVMLSAEKGLTGLEWAAGIYGSVGGAIRGNAGAFEGSMADVVKQVEVLKDGKVEIIKDFEFNYRDSVFKKNKDLIILSVVLELKKGKGVEQEIEKNLQYRKDRHPLEYPSAGSIFKNPKIDSAGSLIEKAGLKGKRIGNAKVSDKHCNFIINLGRARADDVIALIDSIKKQVGDLFGVELKEEIVIVKK